MARLAHPLCFWKERNGWIFQNEVVPANVSALAKVHRYGIAIKHSIIWSSKFLASHDSYQCCIEKKAKILLCQPIAHFAAPFLNEQLEEQPFKKLGITNKNSPGVIWSDSFYFSRNCKTKLEKLLDWLQKTFISSRFEFFSSAVFPCLPLCSSRKEQSDLRGISAVKSQATSISAEVPSVPISMLG